MRTRRICAAAAARRGSAAILGLAALLLAGCAAAPPTPAGVAAAQPTAAPPRAAQPLDGAVTSLTDALLAKADLANARPLVIDPLVDRTTGAETAATRSVGDGIATRVRSRHPQVQLRPFSIASLGEQPLAVLGSIQGVVAAGSTAPASGAPGAYRIWAVLADLRTGRVITREMVWVRPEDINPAPAAFFQASPAWTADPVTAAYIRTCSSTAGTPIDPLYLRAVRAQALVADATGAFEAGRYREALARYDEALREPGGEQLRALNGIYLSEWALGRRRNAEAAFARIVEYGLSQGTLAVKLVFRAGSTAFWPDPAVSGPYRMWLRQIAVRTQDRAACLLVAGHTSPTGSPALNEELSLARARRVEAQLVAQRAALRGRLTAEGFGSKQTLVGTGADDASDALDRRVEFKPRSCQVAGAADAGRG